MTRIVCEIRSKGIKYAVASFIVDHHVIPEIGDDLKVIAIEG